MPIPKFYLNILRVDSKNYNNSLIYFSIHFGYFLNALFIATFVIFVI
jgi:hypothetical protein